MNISFSSPTLNKGYYSGLKITYGKEQSGNKASKQDSLFISKEAQNKQSMSGKLKLSNAIEGFMKQKGDLLESEYKLIEKTLESGGNVSSIKNQLTDFDNQIRLMDEQISQ